MAEVRYLVVKRNGAWKVVSRALQMGPYRDRLEAIDVAIELADRDGRDGRDSQVLVRGEDKQERIEWTYGRDPYPEFLPQLKAAPIKAAPIKTAPRKTAPRRKPVLAREPALVRLPIG
jgi:hypothetical protein